MCVRVSVCVRLNRLKMFSHILVMNDVYQSLKTRLIFAAWERGEEGERERFSGWLHRTIHLFHSVMTGIGHMLGSLPHSPQLTRHPFLPAPHAKINVLNALFKRIRLVFS